MCRLINTRTTRSAKRSYCSICCRPIFKGQMKVRETAIVNGDLHYLHYHDTCHRERQSHDDHQ